MNNIEDIETFEIGPRDQNEHLFNLGKRGKNNTRRQKDHATRDFINKEVDEVAELAKIVRKYTYEQLQSRKGKPGAPGKKKAPYSGGRLGVNIAEHTMLYYLCDHPENFPYADTTVEKLVVMYLILFSKLRLVSIADRMAKLNAGKSNSSQKHPVRHAVLPKTVTEEQIILAFKCLNFSREEWEQFDPKKEPIPVGVTEANKETYRIRAGIWRDRSLRNPLKREVIQIMEPSLEDSSPKTMDFDLQFGAQCVRFVDGEMNAIDEFIGAWDEAESESSSESVASLVVPEEGMVTLGSTRADYVHDVQTIRAVLVQLPGPARKRTAKRVLEASRHTRSIVDFLDVLEPEFAGVLSIPSVQIFVQALDETFLFDILVGSIVTAKSGSIVTFKNRPMGACHTLVKGDEHATFSIRGVGIGGKRGKKQTDTGGGRKKNRNRGITGNGAYNIKELRDELKNVAKGAVRTALSGGGRAVGSHVGGVLGKRDWGAGLGALAGEKFARLILGKGDYQINNAPKSNSLINPRAARGSPPGFGSDVISLRHREYFSDVLSSSTFTQTRYVMNPGNYTMFPFASQIARNYEKYRLKGAVITFNSVTTNYVSTGLLGKVVMLCNENPYLPDYRNVLQMENSNDAIAFKPDDNALYGVECKRPAMQEYFIRRDDMTVPTAAQGLFDFGEFYVGVVTPGFTSGQVIGELWITYDVEFCMPRLSSTIFGYAHFTGAASTSTSGSLNFVQNNLNTLSGALSESKILADGHITLSALPKDVAFSVSVYASTFTASIMWFTISCTGAASYTDFESTSAVVDAQNTFSSPTGTNTAFAQIYSADFITTSAAACTVYVNADAKQYSSLEIKINIINGTATTPVAGFG